MCGYIKIYREIRSHWIFQNAEYYQWWSELLFDANYKDTRCLSGNKVVTVKRGELIAGINSLSERWGRSKTKIIKFLKLLEEEHMITRKVDNLTPIITICNYESYQGGMDNLVDNPMDTSVDTDVDTSKESKEIKEINNNNLNARTREERVAWSMEREASLKAAFKANGNAMALSRETKLSATTIFEYLDRFMDACQIGNRGHNDIGHFGNDFRNFVKDPKNKPTQQKKKVISNEDLYREMYNL